MKTSTRSSPPRTLLLTLVMGLAALLGYAQTPKTALQKQFDELVERYQQAKADYQKAIEEAKTVAERKKLRGNRPAEKFIADFESLAKSARGDDVAAQAWMNVAGLAAEAGKRDTAIKALDTLLADHVQSPSLEPLPMIIARTLSQFLEPKQVDDALLKLAEKSPHKNIQAAALFTYGMSILEDEKAPEERKKSGLAALERLQKDFADVKGERGQVYAQQAAGTLFERDHLQIGMVAPDFEVTDENGVKFKLSDYRGKVVVIDFWGYW